jgi:hypothetical protein
MYDIDTTSNPFTDLIDHAMGKLAEEQAYHARLARQGKRAHGNRHDRRPLWAATVILARIYAQQPTPQEVKWRGDAWGWLCARAKHLMANNDPFDSIIRLALVSRLPRNEAIELLAERAAHRERREQDRKDARVAQLRAELRALEGAPPPEEEEEALPDNVVRFRLGA